MMPVTRVIFVDFYLSELDLLVNEVSDVLLTEVAFGFISPHFQYLLISFVGQPKKLLMLFRDSILMTLQATSLLLLYFVY